MHMHISVLVLVISTISVLPYGGKIWRGETLANSVNDHKFAKFKPYFSNTSRVAEAKLACYICR